MGLDMYFYLKEKNRAEGWTQGSDDEYRAFGHWNAETGVPDETKYPEDIKNLAEYIFNAHLILVTMVLDNIKLATLENLMHYMLI